MTTVALKHAESFELSKDDQAVVKEFNSVLRKHAKRSAGSLARLAGVAFSQSFGGGSTRREKLDLAMARGVLARQELMDEEGGSLSSEAVSGLLGLSKQAVMKRLKAGTLLAWREERLKAARFPRWQFDSHGHVLPGFEEALGILNQDERLDTWAKMLFFLQEKPALGGKRPLDLLREKKLDQVRLSAQAYVE